MGKLNATHQFPNDYSSQTKISTQLEPAHNNHNRSILFHCILHRNLPLLKLDDEKLVYRAEGNANLVLSMTDTTQVLRIRKTCRTEFNTKDNSVLLASLHQSVEYVKLISKFFDDNYTIEPKIVKLEAQDYDKFNQWLTCYRPAERLDKDVRCHFGTIYPDVAFLQRDLISQRKTNNHTDNYCVEIKPKQGWTFYDSNKTNMRKLFGSCVDMKICRYCSMQYLKLQKKTIKEVSSYCPIDLFSGTLSRMTNAIKGLIESPQNNFRFFKNGNLIYGDKISKSSLDDALEELFSHSDKEKNQISFIEFLVKALLKDFSSKGYDDINPILIQKNIQKTNCEPIIQNQLPSKCVLKKILDLQLLVQDCLTNHEDFSENSPSFDHVTDLINRFQSYKNLLSFPCINNLKTELKHKEKYLLGATALDCSVMITFQKLENDEINCDDEKFQRHIIGVSADIEENTNFLANVTVMDLDPKSNLHADKYIKKTNTSYNALKEYLVYFREDNTV